MRHFHPWHDVEIGTKSPKEINMIVEIPKGSKVKYELDKKTGLLKYDRAMYSAVFYPGDYGFIPQTLWHDGDPLDIFVFGHEPVYPMTLCNVRVIGVLHMHDNKEEDSKILAVYLRDPRFSDWKSLRDVPSHYMKEVTHFFETYKDLQKKEVKVFKAEGKRAAYKCIKDAHKMYLEKHPKTDDKK